MARFSTTYYVEGYPYAAEIEAASIEHARTVAAQRGLNETVIGERDPDQQPPTLGVANIVRRGLEPDSLAAAIHEACFLCWLGLESGAITPREALGDKGLIHSLAHLACGDPHDVDGQKDHIAQLERDIAARVPGWVSSVEFGCSPPRDEWLASGEA